MSDEPTTRERILSEVEAANPEPREPDADAEREVEIARQLLADAKADPDVSSAPPRYKTIERLTVAEHLERRVTGQLPERDEYRAYRAEVLRRAGVEDEPGRETPGIGDLDVAGHLARIRRFTD